MVDTNLERIGSLSLYGINEKAEFYLYRETEVINYYQKINVNDYKRMASLDIKNVKNFLISKKILFFLMFFILLSSNPSFATSKTEREFRKSIVLNSSIRNTLNYSYITSLLIGFFDILELSNIELKPYISTIGYISNLLLTCGKCYYTHIKNEWIKESNFSSFLFNKFNKFSPTP